MTLPEKKNLCPFNEPSWNNRVHLYHNEWPIEIDWHWLSLIMFSLWNLQTLFCFTSRATAVSSSHIKPVQWEHLKKSAQGVVSDVFSFALEEVWERTILYCRNNSCQLSAEFTVEFENKCPSCRLNGSLGIWGGQILGSVTKWGCVYNFICKTPLDSVRFFVGFLRITVRKCNFYNTLS